MSWIGMGMTVESSTGQLIHPWYWRIWRIPDGGDPTQYIKRWSERYQRARYFVISEEEYDTYWAGVIKAQPARDDSPIDGSIYLIS